MFSFIIVSPGTTGTDEPPGMQALIFRPPFMPPAISSRSANEMPSGTSKLPGFATCPETEKMTVPPEFFGPSAANHSAPLRRIVGTDAKLCVLLMVVGAPYRPNAAGNGGLKRGLPG